MKLSTYVAQFLAKQGIRHAFAITGGASLHLIDSIDATEGIDFVCPNHEQAGAMAADAYARVTGGLGAAIATSGPGATNMITGICCAYYDSVPVIYISGQVASFRLKKNTGVRQLGFQETEVVDMVKPITKYAVQILDPKHIRYEMEKATFIAKSGRPGPVLIDIPDDFQRVDIDPEALETFTPPEEVKETPNLNLDKCLELLKEAKRPVIILGWGIRLAGATEEANHVVQKLGIPVVPTWGMVDFLPGHDPLLVGGFGLHGTRYGNFAVQNADCILSIGTRLDTHETGSPLASFAREGKKIIVDIDPCELTKFVAFGMSPELTIQADAKEFLQALSPKLEDFSLPDITHWKKQIEQWKTDFDICPKAYYEEEKLNPYVFVKALSKASSEGDTIIVDTGCAVAWMAQAFDFKQGQRFFSAFNNTPMGYALPAAIGASFALNQSPIICVVGDGSLMMNIQELSVVLKHRLPIKVFLIDNGGYSMIQQTQDQWLKSNYTASSSSRDLAFPDFTAVAKAHGYPTVEIAMNHEVEGKVQEVLKSSGPFFCRVVVDPNHRVIPQVVFGRPIEDAGPLLPRDVFLKNMIVKPMDVSTK